MKYFYADFSHMEFLSSDSVDAVISTSAIEHNENAEVIRKSILEFERILKPEGAIFITTSAAKEETWWHEPSKGWCFSEADLCKMFKLENKYFFKNEYDSVLLNLQQSKFLQDRLPSYYLGNPNCGLPYGKWEPKYVPVGISKYNKSMDEKNVCK